MNTLQEWYLINPSVSQAHPIHIHVNHFQVCRQSICWRRTIIDHKVSETESEIVVSILKSLFVNLDCNKIFKLIIKLEKLSQILHIVWIFWLLSVPSFLFELRIWARIKTWFGYVWRNAIETQRENLMLFYSTTQSVQVIIVNRFLEKFLWPYFSLRLYDRSQILFQKYASPECCQTFHKDDFKV